MQRIRGSDAAVVSGMAMGAAMGSDGLQDEHVRGFTG